MLLDIETVRSVDCEKLCVLVEFRESVRDTSLEKLRDPVVSCDFDFVAGPAGSG